MASDPFQNEIGGYLMTQGASEGGEPGPALSRRLFLFGAPALLAGCNEAGHLSAAFSGTYGPLQDNGVSVPAIDTSQFDARFLRQTVPFSGREAPGTIIVETNNRFLYYVLPGGNAVRYGIGVGRDGFALRGNAVVGHKNVWPRWTPTPNMMARDPSLRKYAGGMPGGINNPLGARALYLYRGGRDTLYRIHGTNEPWSIGRAMSSGCIRMLNQDAIDLYNRVRPGATVIVRHGPALVASR